MPLTKLQFRPGVVKDLTSYSNEGGWRDSDKVRFRLGFPEKIGGWEKYSSQTFLGTCRALHNWIALDSSNFMGLGTTSKYYVEQGGVYNDITPIRETTAAGDVTFARFVIGFPTINVFDNAHGAVAGDSVTFSDAVSLGGDITADVLNQEYQISAISSDNEYTIVAKDPVTGNPVPAQSSDVGNGGTATVGEYQINSGLDTQVGGTGWGAGFYGGPSGHTPASSILSGSISPASPSMNLVSSSGFPTSGRVVVDSEIIAYTGVAGNTLTGLDRGAFGTTAAPHSPGATVTEATYGWGMPSDLTTTQQIRLWSHDNFGEDLLINPRDSGIFYWDKSEGAGVRAVLLKDFPTGVKTSVPTVCKQVLVSDRDRHVIAFGCDGFGATSVDPEGDGIQDNLLIRFSSQENPLDWFPTTANTAGDLRLGAGSTFVTALETKRETLIFTDTSLTSMRFIGPPFTFGLTQLASNITIAGPNAAISTEDFVFWMGIDNFYVHAGQTAQLPCTVKDKVFTDFNLGQINKVYAGVNSEFAEVTWFYPSADSEENNKYVSYNYLEKVWYFGSLARTAWLDRGVRNFPAATNANYLYSHEFGYDDDGAAMDSFIESSVMDIADGDHFTYIRRVIPDLTFVGSTETSSPQATFTLKARNDPGSNFDSVQSGSTVRTATSPVEQFTGELDLRVRGRSFALRVESNALGSKWRLGSPRVDMRPDGRR